MEFKILAPLQNYSSFLLVAPPLDLMEVDKSFVPKQASNMKTSITTSEQAIVDLHIFPSHFWFDFVLSYSILKNIILEK